MAKKKTRKPRTTNLGIRAYAMSKGYTLGDIARYLGKTPSWFSMVYMSREMSEEDKEDVLGIIDRMAADGYKKVQRT